MLRANLRSSLVLKNRPERLSSTVQKKAPLTGAPRPAGIDGLKFDKVNVEEIQQRFESVEESLRHIKAASTSTNQPDAGNSCQISTSITFFRRKYETVPHWILDFCSCIFRWIFLCLFRPAGC